MPFLCQIKFCKQHIEITIWLPNHIKFILLSYSSYISNYFLRFIIFLNIISFCMNQHPSPTSTPCTSTRWDGSRACSRRASTIRRKWTISKSDSWYCARILLTRYMLIYVGAYSRRCVVFDFFYSSDYNLMFYILIVLMSQSYCHRAFWVLLPIYKPPPILGTTWKRILRCCCN